jgi:hypothetical protein
MICEPYHFPRRLLDGRWIVCHNLPGQPGAYAADCECVSQRAAQLAADDLNAQRIQRARAVLAHVRSLGPLTHAANESNA